MFELVDWKFITRMFMLVVGATICALWANYLDSKYIRTECGEE